MLISLIRKILFLLHQAWITFGITIVILLLFNWIAKGIILTFKSRNTTHESMWNSLQEPWAEEYHKQFKASYTAVWEPYVYWKRHEYHGSMINVDEFGQRQTWQHPQLPKDAPSVFMFGGSTMWGTGARDDHTIPSLVAKLRQDQRLWKVINFGESGYVNTQEVIKLYRLLQSGARPQHVIFYDGVNDVFSAYQNHVAGLPQNEDNRRKEFNYKPKLSHVLFNTALNTPLLQLIGPEPKPFEPEFTSEELELLASDIVRLYLANVEVVRALSVTFGFSAHFFWQPVIFTKQPVSVNEQLILNSAKHLQDLYHLTYAKMAEHYHSHNINDLSKALDSEETFYLDYCHVNEAGNANIAHMISQSIAQ